MKKGIGSHQSARMGKDEWLTPPELLKALGDFDLDPCAPEKRPWDMAKKHYTKKQNGLMQPWNGRIWCNPPYGSETAKWLKMLHEHGNGIALIFARTETKMFFECIWNKADAMLFLEGRLHFHHVTGERSVINAGGPSVLVAYGKNNVQTLKNSNIKGKFINLKQ